MLSFMRANLSQSTLNERVESCCFECGRGEFGKEGLVEVVLEMFECESEIEDLDLAGRRGSFDDWSRRNDSESCESEEGRE